MRERRSDALPSRMLRAFRGSGRQAKEAKLRDRAVSAETVMFATGDPLVARPTGRWTEGRVSGTRRAWPQGRRLLLREKHRPRKSRNSRSREVLPGLGGRYFLGSTGTRPEARGPRQRADGFSFGETVFPARQQNPFAGGAAWTRRPGFLGGGAREPKARVGARDRSSGKAAPCKGRWAARRQGTGSPGTSSCSSGPMPGTLSVPGAGPAPGASGGVPPGHLTRAFQASVLAPFFYHLAAGGATRLCGTLCSAPI